MQLKLVHAVSSGIVVALVLGLFLAPSIWEMSGHPQPGPVVSLEEKGGRGGVEDLDIAPQPSSPESVEIPSTLANFSKQSFILFDRTGIFYLTDRASYA